MHKFSNGVAVEYWDGDRDHCRCPNCNLRAQLNRHFLRTDCPFCDKAYKVGMG